jgi:hypothetical protein
MVERRAGVYRPALFFALPFHSRSLPGALRIAKLVFGVPGFFAQCSLQGWRRKVAATNFANFADLAPRFA